MQVDHNSVTVSVDGVSHADRLVLATRPGEQIVFAIFALCGAPDPGTRGSYCPGWLHQFAIDEAWFLGTWPD